LVPYRKLGTGTKCKSIPGLAQNTWTSPKFFGTCRRTRQTSTNHGDSHFTTTNLTNVHSIMPYLISIDVNTILFIFLGFHRKFPGTPQETPRKLPGNSQETPRKLPGNPQETSILFVFLGFHRSGFSFWSFLETFVFFKLGIEAVEIKSVDNFLLTEGEFLNLS